ncbi:MAG: 5'/3'-nucleotidase SurE [Clostridia bacterium]|nr:5'/3'-nucleotidase SurE [Clostridia bacterium]
MRILLVNDDGINAEGIRTLMRTLSKEHEVFAVAPDRQRSAASMAMTLDTPLRAVPVPVDLPVAGAFAVDGTPVDCARLALGNLVQEPDLVISGINLGPNLGTDTLYSGTCAAAQEAALYGLQAIAMSLDHRNPTHFETALAVTERMIGIVERHPLPTGLFYNVNVPDLPIAEIRGYKVTHLAYVRYNGVYEKREDPLGKPYYWVPRGKLPCEADEDTDYAWMKKGYVTVTPMSFDSAKLDAVDLKEEFGGEA